MKSVRWWIWLLAGAVLVSVATNIFLAKELRQFYAERLQAQIYPAGQPQSPRVTSDARHYQSTILLFGDSRMAAWTFPPMAGVRLVNGGVNGATTAQLRLRLPQLLEEFHPDVVVLQAGINDLKLAGIQPERAEELVAQAADNLEAMAADCLAHHCRVLLLLTWPPGPPEWRRLPVWNQQVPEAVTRLNLRLKAFGATHQNAVVVDLLAEGGRQPTPADFKDALHFRPEFYQHLTPPLLRRLQKLETAP